VISCDFVEPRPPRVQALVEAGTENRFRRHDVERGEPGDPRQQIEVRGKQAMLVGDPIRHGDDHVTDRRACRLRDQPLAQRVLVTSVGLAHAAFVVTKRIGQKPRLAPHPLGRAVDVVGAERTVNQLLEPFHVLRLTTQVIVEAQQLGDEPRPELKRELGADACRRAGGGLRHDVAFDRPEPPRGARKPAVQAVI
jgi:hypothetical protein